jgi:thioester reductase-like protein
MIPTLWVEMNVLPTHGVSGKIDLKALPAPPTPKTQTNGVEKESNTTIKVDTIIRLWADVLNMPASAIKEEHDFFDIGGHSLVLAVLANKFSKEFGFAVPLAPLAGCPTLQGHMDAIRDARDGHTAAVQADLPRILRADIELDEDIKSDGTPMRQLSDAKTVLLTGATGYLGAFLLKSLIQHTTATIVCLVRFTDPQDDCRPAGFARIRKNLVDLGLWDDAMLERMEVLPGNLSGRRLGLTVEAFELVAERVEVIIHAAATVNLVYPYAALRNANVGGTREILRLAAKSGATLHHISTNGVLVPSVEGWSEDAMVDLEDVPDKLLDGYGQTKWVAEMLVCEASRRGMPVKIYRPGTISGHSVTGSTNTYDLLNALIVESLQLGCAPSIEQWFAEMTPADFVTDAIITLANHTETDQLVYHLGDSNPVSASGLFDSLNELGYSTTRIPWDDWVALWNEKRGSGKVRDEPFTVDILRGGMPTVETLQSVTVLKDDATRAALALYGVYRPSIDSALLETYTRHFFARGWLSRPPKRLEGGAVSRKSKGRLAGKVAVITGASSGIGAAVAVGLAKEGAHIVLAARRTDALEGVKRKMAQAGCSGKVLIHKTDVTVKTQVESLIATTESSLGPVDILVSCAGVMYFTMMANVQTDEWERTVDVNCKGLLHCLSSTVPGMLARGAGHIIAISSDAGRKVFPGLGVYSASKFFVEATLQALRVETAGTGLRVTSIQPGNTATELLGMSTDAEAIKKYGEPTGAKVLDAEDVAGSIVYAVCQPEHVAVNEVLIEPRDEPI